MRLELTGRHLGITPATRKLVEQRIAHTLKLLNDSAVSAHVVLTREHTRIHAEVTIHAMREKYLHGEATGQNLERALNAAADKVDRQARTLKGKLDGRKRGGDAAARAAALEAPPVRSAAGRASPPQRLRIIRARQYAVKPMSIEDAAAEISDGKNGFIVFRNSSNDAITVLFRRPDGHLGLIEPEA